MTTKAQVLAAARKRWGKAAYVNENRRAPTATEREVNGATKARLRDRVKEIDAETKSLGMVLPPLLAAARFAVDVDGGPPSLDQLRVATERAERQQSLLDERRTCRAEHDSLNGHSKRWSAGAITSIAGFAMAHVRAEADTIDELLAAIQAPKPVG